MSLHLDVLSSRDRDAVLNAVVAVEESVDPALESQFPALADPALRELVSDSLAGAGRTLVQATKGAWTSGYDDSVADRLAQEGVGVLAPVDAAVLTLVMLHAVAIPAARGNVGAGDWSSADLTPVNFDDLTNNRDRRLTNKAVRASLRRLRDAGVLRTKGRSSVLPGPQFRRLTDERSRLIWENLIIATAPTSSLTRSILRRRENVDNA